VNRIRILDQTTVGRIAAGEVIERPASVVKELVENSLDAGASWISVEVGDAGCSQITVRDDGSGIDSSDLPLALRRHATSKLRSAEDLRCVPTLGFRGEGLASIAAAARTVRLTSRTAGQQFGATIEARDGSLSGVTRTASPPGTSVSVEELFAATPVRREFLKSQKAESARIASLLAHIALGWPRVGFSFRQDGRDMWSLPAAGHAHDRAELVFGRGSRGALVAVESATGPVRIDGLTSKVGFDRSNRQGQIVFVNRRLVYSAELTAAWSAGYTSMMMTGRYPYGVLMVTVPDDDVDVNVHPAKAQVRFRDSQPLFDAARRAVRSAVAPSSASQPPPSDAQPAASVVDPAPELSLLTGTAAEARGGAPAGGLNGAMVALRPLGQIDQTFIVISHGDELVIVDQHAAHERIAFEFLLQQSERPSPATPLLFPLVYELTPGQIETLHRCERDLARAGIEMEAFGDGVYRISAIPENFGRRRFDLNAMLDTLGREDGTADAESHRRRILATVACHSVVRAHEPLALQEQLSLYERLKDCEEPHTCPHGRPTVLRLDAEHLAKAFRRT